MRIPLLRPVDGLEIPTAPMLNRGHPLAQGIKGVWAFSNAAVVGPNSGFSLNPSIPDLASNYSTFTGSPSFGVVGERKPYPTGGYGLKIRTPGTFPSGSGEPHWLNCWQYAGALGTTQRLDGCLTRGTMLVVRRHLNPPPWSNIGGISLAVLGAQEGPAYNAWNFRFALQPDPAFSFGGSNLVFPRPASFGTVHVGGTPGPDGIITAIAGVAGPRGMAVYVDGLLAAETATPAIARYSTVGTIFQAGLWDELYFVAHLDAEYTHAQVLEWTRDPFVFLRPSRALGGGSLLALEPDPDPQPVGTGTILVRKHTNPAAGDQLFTFNAEPGLGSFSLADGEEHLIENLLPGEYSITETPPTGWAQDGDPVVSNGDPATAIVLTDSDLDVEVDFANVFTGEEPEPDPDEQPPDIDDDLGECPEATLRIVNLALQRIGVNQAIVALDTEDTPEAAAVRLAYDLTLDATLRDRAWPFATKYVHLTLEDGSPSDPVNGDWTYRYAIPNDCVFARRLVTAREGAVNPTPPPMYIGSSAVIFTNQENAELEYTARVKCPAEAGDATFRSAWAWRLASEIAPALSRMADREAFCMQQYQIGLAAADHFLRLGKPGIRPEADVDDPDTECGAAKRRVLNTALVRIGAKTIADLTTEQSREAQTALLVYEDELQSTLRDYDWPFATAYATPLTLVAGTLTAYATPDWIYAYRLPTNALKARRIVKPKDTMGVGRAFDPTPAPFRIGADDTGPLVYTNEVDAVLEYTIRRGCTVARGDALFRDAFAWRMAAALAPSLAIPDPVAEEQTGRTPTPQQPRESEGGQVGLQKLRAQRAVFCWQQYLRTLRLAEVAAANEQQQEPHGEADWIRARE